MNPHTLHSMMAPDVSPGVLAAVLLTALALVCMLNDMRMRTDSHQRRVALENESERRNRWRLHLHPWIDRFGRLLRSLRR